MNKAFTISVPIHIQGDTGYLPIDSTLNSRSRRPVANSRVSEEFAKVNADLKHAARMLSSKIEKAGDSFAKKEDIPTKVSELSNDIGFTTKDDFPKKVSEFENDLGYLRAHQSLKDYYKKNETSSCNEISGALDAYQLSGEYAALSDIPLSTSELANDSGFLTEHQPLSNYWTKAQTSSATQLRLAFDNFQPIEDYYTKAETSSKAQLTNAFNDRYLKSATSSAAELKLEFGSLSTAAQISGAIDTAKSNAISTADSHILVCSSLIYLKTQTSSSNEISSELNRYQLSGNYALCSDLPTNVSQLANDVGYLSSHQSLSNYYTKGETSSAAELSDAIPIKVSELENDSGYLSAHQSLTAYWTKSQTSAASELSIEFNKYQLSNSALQKVTETIVDRAAKAVSVDTTYDIATDSTAGLVKIGYAEDKAKHRYPVKLSESKMFVEVPWTDVAIESAWYDNANTTINIKFNDSAKDSISVNVEDLVDTYTAGGNGLDLADHQFSLDYGTISSKLSLSNYQLTGEYITSGEVDFKLTPYELTSVAEARLSVLSDYALLSVLSDYAQLSDIPDVPTDYVDLTSSQNIKGLKTFGDGLKIKPKPELAPGYVGNQTSLSIGIDSISKTISTVKTGDDTKEFNYPSKSGRLLVDTEGYATEEWLNANIIHLSGEPDKMVGPLHLSSNFAVGPYSNSQSLGSFACGGESESVAVQAIVSGMYVLRCFKCVGLAQQTEVRADGGYYMDMAGNWIKANNSDLVIIDGVGYLWSNCKTPSSPSTPEFTWIECPNYSVSDTDLTAYPYLLSVGTELSDSLVEMNSNLTSYTDACFSIDSSLYCDPHTVVAVRPDKGIICFNNDSPDGYLAAALTATTHVPSNPDKGTYKHKVYFYKHPTLPGNWTFALHGPAFAFGEDVVAAADDSFAVGCRTYAIGRGSIAVGVHDEAGAYAIAAGYGAHAYAYGSMAIGAASYSGTAVTSKPAVIIHEPAKRAFAWGYAENSNNPYVLSSSDRVGTFNINPKGGINGFYIGHTNLSSFLATNFIKREEYSDDHEFVIAVTNAAGKMFVTKDQTYHVDDDYVIRKYGCLKAALDTHSDFEGYVDVVEDIDTISSFTGVTTDTPLNIDRRLVLDLCDHIVDVDTKTFITLSSNSTIDRLPDLTLRNGKITAEATPTVAGPMFTAYHGNLYFEDVDVEVDCTNDTSQSSRILRFNSSEDPNYVKKQRISIDRSSTLTMKNANHDEGMVALFTPYFRLVVIGKKMSSADYIAKYGTMDDELAPELVVDGRCEMTYTIDDPDVVTPKHEGDFEPVINYPRFVDTNGSDTRPSKITINENAYLNIKNGIGIYSGSNVQVTLNGGTIIAGTGIAMRGGKLMVPANGHPTVIGTGEYVRYIPYHSMVVRVDAEGSEVSGSDAQLFLNLGHAIVFESNGTSYGGHNIEADIQAGKFISYHNTPIASYGIATTSKTSYPVTLSYNGGTYTRYINERIKNFVSGGELSRIPSVSEYGLADGANADYNIMVVSDAYVTAAPLISQLVFNESETADLTTNEGKTEAIKKILLLLGMKESNIKTL